ncbi:elongation factor G [Selenomonas sp. WCT3]|uniref:elongation factor G n=1 Tax=unclassified Selenomonas TaxID=2637378 RepID=UPI0008873528|nr:elongation factor G [Selenomonas sp.]MCR5438843.1 elongation factor G [Selenomonas sp.]SDG54791.1 elongation factor G [Selenomonas ruminantium]
MKNYKSANIRNIAVVGHGKTGKTSLLDACLFDAEAVKRLGNVEDGTSALDYEPEETKRGMTVNLKLAACEWRDFKLNFIDTPGYPDFVGDVKGAMAAADSALIVISASSGIKSGTENAWWYAEENELPRAFFINKMDREHADFYGVVEELRVRFGDGVVPVQLPIGKEAAFQGVVDLLSLHMKIVTHDKEVVKDDVPEYMKEEVEQARQKMIESISEFNDELLEKYIEGTEISEVETAAALIEGIQAGKIFPVFCGSAKQNIGMRKLMNDLVEYMPTPYFKVSIGMDPVSGELKERHTEDAFSAQVFKTIVDPFVGRQSYIRILSGEMRGDISYNHPNKDTEERIGTLFTLQGKQQHNLNVAAAGDIVVTTKLQQVKTGDTLCDKNDAIQYEGILYPTAMLEMAASAHKKGEEDKVFGALAKQQDEDPTLLVEKNQETGETIVRGIGEVHLEILAEKLERKFGAQLDLAEPRIPYRETIRKTVKVQGRHKKQSGGHGQFGDVWLEIGPRDAGTGNEFSETIFGGSVPKQYIPAVEKGTAETLAQGVLAGYPVVDVKVNLYDGSYHPVDSSEAAFKTAAAIAIKKGVMEAAPILLEPIETIKVLTPEYYLGDVMGRLNSKRAHVLGVDSKERDMSEIQALIPQAELYKFATELRSLTQGRGSYELEFARYEPVPERAAEAIIEAANAR